MSGFFDAFLRLAGDFRALFGDFFGDTFLVFPLPLTGLESTLRGRPLLRVDIRLFGDLFSDFFDDALEIIF